MPKRTDIKTILILGSGPIVIGQGCEFDYSGTQACKALKAEGYRIVLVNSNPATIMTDPQFSDRTYIEPITPEAVRKIIIAEDTRGPRIDAILPTLGGQTALNCACALWDNGTLKEFNVEMIGANRTVIHRAEDRQTFKDIVTGLGLKMPKAAAVNTLEEAESFLTQIGLPAIIRPAFTLGGSGGGIAYNKEEFREIVQRGLAASMIHQVQVDQSVIGWKEYELEVVRDKKDNCIIVCGVENIDPMGVHTGDSITVAPILTLSDKEYQAMRDAAFAIMRAVGVETGGSNVQFAVNPAPKDGKFEMVVVEMNPRVSRSSALASKATGFPIAKIAAKLAAGYTLDELRNDITGTTSACFEPAIDYVVVKIPRWTFEKFPEADETLTTQMKSVGEVMAIGRTFKESLQKAIRSLDVKRFGFGLDRNDAWLAAMRAVEHDQLVLDVSPGAKPGTGSVSDTGLRTADGRQIEWPIPLDKLSRKLSVPSQGRFYYIRYAFKMGWSLEKIADLTRIDPFFLDQMKELVEFEDTLCDYKHLEDVPAATLFRAKQLGYSDAQLANLYLGKISPDTILQVRARRKALAIEPVFKLVDTCAAEFEAVTPYYYSTYEAPVRGTPSDEIRITDRKKVVILGGGPNRVGQGIEFDYCCCHAAYAAKELGLESVMINSNPETVSTDYDTSDLLFFEPLTLEDVLNVVERLNAQAPRVLEMPHPARASVFEFADPLDAAEISPDVVRSCVKDALSEIGATIGVLFDVQPISDATADGTVIDPRSGWTAQFVVDDGSVYELEAGPGNPPISSKLWHDFETAPPDSSFAHHSALVDEPVHRERIALALRSSALVLGTIVQFGGQTPLNLAKGLVAAGAPIIGTSLDSIDLAEDRDRFDALLVKLKLQRPAAGIARSVPEAVKEAARIGYPVLIRPSYVLGGRGMEICPDEKALLSFINTALESSGMDEAPVLIDKFLAGATEVDVDVVGDSSGEVRIAGVMEQIEHAGIHSGDSACTLPPASLPAETVARIQSLAKDIARELRVVGLMNIQLAVKDGEIFILEVNPRASRTVPFVSKVTHTPWPAIAAKCMMGGLLKNLMASYSGTSELRNSGTPYWAVKESVFPFGKFPGVDVVLGPEMRSTGEVMGIDASLPIAFAKSQMAAGTSLPTDPAKGSVFVSVREQDRDSIIEPVRILLECGFDICATGGTASHLAAHNLPVRVLQKIATGARPNVIDLMANGQIALIVNTPTRTGWQTDEGRIRSTAVRLNVPMISTTTAALAAAKAIRAMRERDWGVAALQDYAALSEPPMVEPIIRTAMAPKV